MRSKKGERKQLSALFYRDSNDPDEKRLELILCVGQIKTMKRRLKFVRTYIEREGRFKSEL